MTTLDVKICGLSEAETLRVAVQCGATHTGFIFFEKSPRHVSIDTAATLAALSKDLGARPVAVTVNADRETLDAIVERMQPSVLQFHGAETPEALADAKARYGLEVWKALAVSTVADFAKLDPYRGVADRFLLDAKPPKGSDLPGGNAVSFDWSILKDLPAGTDYLLAGGITPDNVGDALAAHPPGLDISSGVESAPGVKDAEKIRALFEGIGRQSS